MCGSDGDSGLQTVNSTAREIAVFLLEPAPSCSKVLLPREWVDFSSDLFSARFLHLRVDFLCHNPVTLAVVYEFDILI